MSTPPQPEGARLRHEDGSVTPLELVYEGIDEDQCHIWVATTVYNPQTDTVEVDEMPGKTGLQLRLPPGFLPPRNDIENE